MSSILKVDQIQLSNGNTPTAGDLGLNTTGSVLQVVNGTTQTQEQHTDTAWSDTGLQATITPTSTSSKILVMVNQSCYSVRYGGAIRVLKGSSAIFQPGANYSFYLDPGNNSNWRNYQSFNYLDSPSTTSAITYKTQGLSNSSLGGSFRTQQGGYFRSFITLMEIAG